MILFIFDWACVITSQKEAKQCDMIKPSKRGGTKMAVVHVTNQNFHEEVINSEKTVLLDFLDMCIRDSRWKVQNFLISTSEERNGALRLFPIPFRISGRILKPFSRKP